MKFKLYDFIEGGVNLMVTKTAKSGKGLTNAYTFFEAGKVYNTSDPIVEKWVRGEIPGAEMDAVANDQLRQVLAYYNVPYTSHKCGSCSTAKPHFKYNPFVIKEEEDAK